MTVVSRLDKAAETPPARVAAITTPVVVAAPKAAAPAGSSGVSLASSVLALLALGLVAFLVQVGPLSWVQHLRSQQVAYADLRTALSDATVPTGQLDVNDHAVPLGRPMGYLTSKALGITREVFFNGTTSGVLEKGPGLLRSSVLPGQPGRAVLFGRSSAYGGPFDGVGSLRVGATISVITGQGDSTYQVTGIRHAGDAVTAPLPGEGALTLVSAEGAAFAPERAVYVDARLTSAPHEAPLPVFGPNSLTASEQVMAGDPSAWPFVFLALQGLALAALGAAFASRRFGGAQTWLVGVPVIGLLLIVSSHEVVRLLPNLL